MKDATTASFPTVPLSDVATVVNGGTPKSKVAEYWGGDVQWLTPKDMGQMESREISQTPRTITQAGLKGSSARLVPAGSVILSTRAPIGHLAMNTAPMAFNQGCRGITPSDKLNPVYLYHFLNRSRQLLNDLGSGTTFKELSATNLKSVKIPLPPLEEQLRIVAVLDEAFEGLNRARAHAEANLQNARELYGRTRDGLLEYGDGWEELLLDDLLENITYGFTNPMPDAVEGPFKITAKNVVGGRIDYENARRTSAEAFNDLLTDKSRPKIGDVLLTKDGTLGRTAVVDRDNICINQSVAVMRPNSRILPEYLAELLACSVHQEAMIADAGGTTIKHLYITRVPKITLQIPEVSEQNRLLEDLDALRCRCRAVENAAFRKLQDLDDLQQSLLQKAFAGELT